MRGGAGVSRRTPPAVLAALLLVAGLWQIGHGAWIYAKARLAQHLLGRAWARTLEGEALAKPWPWADTWPVARLRVPAHGVDLIVLADVSGRTLAFGPGHVSTGGAPGMKGTTIITGHRDTHFKFLARVQPGDDVLVEVPGRPPSRYRVRAAEIVDARVATIRSDDEATLVLLTCYPFDAVRPGGPLRYVVTAEALRS